MRVAYLGHNQAADCRTPKHGHLSEAEAANLVKEMRVERLSRRAIRAFPPTSVFFRHYQPSFIVTLPPIEPNGCKFVPPARVSFADRLKQRLLVLEARQFVQAHA